MLDIQSFRLWVLHVLVVSGCWSMLGSELAFSSVTYHDAASLHVFLMEWAVSAKPVQKGQCKTNVFCTAWHDWDTRPYFSRATSANFSNTKVHIHSTSYSVNFRNLIVKNKILSVLCFVFSFWPPLEIEWVGEWKIAVAVFWTRIDVDCQRPFGNFNKNVPINSILSFLGY